MELGHAWLSGIGPWTADYVLLRGLGRPPRGSALALRRFVECSTSACSATCSGSLDHRTLVTDSASRSI
ncbi:MAG: hypothetical protein DMD33_19330 [Gemmatimonadetes bacterium]|nr:MAG: hypothetical protein DMD33_19330 [Gemmatimonadota bacterium]